MSKALRPLAVVALVSFLAVGCAITSISTSGLGYPAGPTLDQFGMQARCPRSGDCDERAFDLVEGALGRLGERADGGPITDPDGPPPPDRLYLNVDRDPPLEWRSSTGSAGTSLRVALDLTDDPYVVVAPGQAFALTDADAAAIRDALFIPAA